MEDACKMLIVVQALDSPEIRKNTMATTENQGQNFKW